MRLAVLCSEKKTKRNELWTHSWVSRRGQYELSVLQRELKVMNVLTYQENYIKVAIRFAVCKQMLMSCAYPIRERRTASKWGTGH